MKISIIVPVYKAEDYITKAIESILNQTISDFELLLIDDGSPDRSGQICDEYAKRDSRVRVIHQENQGSSAARNKGLSHATGKYIYFMDADDWIEDDMLAEMYAIAEENQADLVVTGFSMEYYLDKGNVTYTTPCPDRKYNSINEFHLDAYHYLNNSLLSLPWNKLFLHENIKKKNLQFIETKWPDHHFCMDYLMDCQNVVLSSITKYHWCRSRKDSSTMIIYADPNLYKKRAEHYRHILQLYDYWNVHDSNSIDGISSYYVGRLTQCVQEISDNKGIKTKEKRKRIKTIINDKMSVDALNSAKSISNMMKIMSWPLKKKNVTLCLVFGGSMSFVRKALPSVFIKLKEKEVHGA